MVTKIDLLIRISPDIFFEYFGNVIDDPTFMEKYSFLQDVYNEECSLNQYFDLRKSFKNFEKKLSDLLKDSQYFCLKGDVDEGYRVVNVQTTFDADVYLWEVEPLLAIWRYDVDLPDFDRGELFQHIGDEIRLNLPELIENSVVARER